jgi:hypothetical protein
MALNRTLKFYGIAFGVVPAEIVAVVNNIEAYRGPVYTMDVLNPLSVDPFAEQRVMFTIEDSSFYNTDFTGIIPVSITTTNGDLVIFTDVKANRWGTFPNPVFTAEQYAVLDNPDATDAEIQAVLVAAANPPFTADEQVLLTNLLAAFPEQSAELNTLREAHNVAYTAHSVDSWEDCFDPVPEVNPEYPWFVRHGETVNCEIQILAFP